MPHILSAAQIRQEDDHKPKEANWSLHYNWKSVFFSNNKVWLPLTDGIGLQSTQASEALLSYLSASFGGSPPVMRRCYPYHQILFDWQQNKSEQFYMKTQK
jgi:hypothetical protein